MNKKNLGQFYTTNHKYILQGLDIPEGIKDIVEPFAGSGDLLNSIDITKYNVECYDIDPKKDFIKRQDTIKHPPDLANKFVITNPPYLARNKCTDKTLFDKYSTNDLYKCFMNILIDSGSSGGIIIIPVNFISSIRKNDVDIRKRFVETYDIMKINIFEEKVFDDTSYSICSFLFLRKNDKINMTTCCIFPTNKQMEFSLCDSNNYTIGGEMYMLHSDNRYKIERATRELVIEDCMTNILVKCIDDNIHSKICLSIVDDKTKKKYIDNTENLSARSYAILVIEPVISEEEQKSLVQSFNSFINVKRDLYNSLFLSNFRESNTIARKRISFGLVYDICGYLLSS